MSTGGNLLLASLSSTDADALRPHLSKVEMPQHMLLCDAGGRVVRVYFPVTAVVSIVVGLLSGAMIETAMVGRDGILFGAAALDGRMSISRAIVQVGGHGFCCDVDRLRDIALQSRTLAALLVRHEQIAHAQAQQSAACNIAHTVEERLARWLLRARDLSASDRLPLTQEYLAAMLGVGRTSVSLVANTFQQAGMIRYSRGMIEIRNLAGLRESACECYAAINEFYRALLKN